MTARPSILATTTAPSRIGKCRLCTCILGNEEEDDLDNGLCCACKKRPEARRLGIPGPPVQGIVNSGFSKVSARAFTPAELSMIRKMHAMVPQQTLLHLLNERLVSDLGPDAAPYTSEQLHDEIAKIPGANIGKGTDWASLRQVLHHAKRSGLLATINEQMIDDFAVVYSLNASQALGLKDIILPLLEDE